MSCPGHAVIGRGGQTFPLCCTDDDGHCACGGGHSDKEAGKAPLTPNGVHDASSDPAQVAKWRIAYCHANWADTGRTYIDIDLQELAARLKQDVGLQAETFLVETPGRNGLHIYLEETAPGSTRSRTLKTTDGQRIGELRRAGQYVVAPGSMRAGKPYRILADNPSLQVPDAEHWLRDVLRGFDVELATFDTDERAEAHADWRGWEDVDADAAFAKALSRMARGEASLLVGILQEPEAYASRFPSLSEIDFVVARMLVKAGLEDAGTVAVWRRSILGQRQKTRLRDDYVTRTLLAAKATLRSDGKSLVSSQLKGEGWEKTKPGGLAGIVRPLQAWLEDCGPDPEWFWRHGIAPGFVTVLAAFLKVGKSTLLWHLLAALSAGRPFLGRPTRAPGASF